MDTLTALLAKMDDRLARQDEILATMNQHLAKQDEMLVAMNQYLLHVVTLTDMARQEATAAHQAMAVALTRYAETRLDIERFIETANRVLTTWERQSR